MDRNRTILRQNDFFLQCFMIVIIINQGKQYRNTMRFYHSANKYMRFWFCKNVSWGLKFYKFLPWCFQFLTWKNKYALFNILFKKQVPKYPFLFLFFVFCFFSFLFSFILRLLCLAIRISNLWIMNKIFMMEYYTIIFSSQNPLIGSTEI